MAWLCAIGAGVAMGIILGLSMTCPPKRDEQSGIYTLHYNGTLYELVRLLGKEELEAMNDD